MAKFVSEKIRKKSGARLAAVQAAYMSAFSGLGIDEVIEDFLKGEVGRYAIEEDRLTGEHLVELEEIDKPYFEKIEQFCSEMEIFSPVKDPERIKNSIMKALGMRDRYTILFYLNDRDLLEKYAEKAAYNLVKRL